jgi:hypothetical protein
MLLNKINKTIFCFWCNKWYSVYEIFLDVLYEGSITCEKDHLLGNQNDQEWQEFFGEKNEKTTEKK